MNEDDAREFVKQTDAIWELEGARPDPELSEQRIKHLTGQITDAELQQYVRQRLADLGITWTPNTD